MINVIDAFDLQFVILIGTIIGPGTILLVLSESFIFVFGLNRLAAYLINFIPVVFFIVICFTLAPKKQVSISQ